MRQVVHGQVRGASVASLNEQQAGSAVRLCAHGVGWEGGKVEEGMADGAALAAALCVKKQGNLCRQAAAPTPSHFAAPCVLKNCLSGLNLP